ncbi:MAG: hypothetical protein DHS20C17_24500 [Cyclobacteriaceae bacterium]|nr:MAG: hypothetical protein DHS20C17_24500 [Cyclobacteriaceae bacterium]
MELNNTKILSTLLFALMMLAFTYSKKTDPTGTWEYKAHTEEGHTGSFVISEEDGALLGNLESQGNEYTMENLKVEGNVMSFDVTTVDGIFCLVKGTIDGDTYSATLTVDYDDMRFEANRVK